MPHAFYIVFLFLLGACIGSFLNVVVWRLPRGESLITPPSHCPKCERPLKWYDNLPIVGWIKLGGTCRFCKAPISVRYPVVETVTALLFVFYYVMFFIVEVGPCPPVQRPMFEGAGVPVYRFVRLEPAMFALYVFLASALLAASLIDAELFEIPPKIPVVVSMVGLAVHTLIDEPHRAGALNTVTPTGATSPGAALAAGGGIGLLASLLLKHYRLIAASFPDGDATIEIDRERHKEEAERARVAGEEPPEPPPEYTPAQIRSEMRKEMLFLLPPMGLAILFWMLTTRVPALRDAWQSVTRPYWVTGFLGSLLGGLVGGFVVWLTRILGSIGFGRLAMGLGDVDLMFAVGTVLGAGAATVAFFLAPFFGLALALYMLITGKKRELPYGPYLSLATGFVMLFSCDIAKWLAPGLRGLAGLLQEIVGGGGAIRSM
jgi:leader peptidase (prepilin peptidase)/N-methyltransferase